MKREIFESLTSLSLAIFLIELMENANLMAAVYMGKVWPKKKFPLIGLKSRLDRLLNTLFP